MSNLPENLPCDTMAAIEYLYGVEKLELDDMKLLVLLEASGEAMYEAMAKAAEPEDAKALLRKTGREEMGHAHRMKRVIELVTGEPFEIPSLEENPYIEALEMPSLPPEVMSAIHQAEDAGGNCYRVWADNEANEEAAALMRRNGLEEEQHAERAQKVLGMLAARA